MKRLVDKVFSGFSRRSEIDSESEILPTAICWVPSEDDFGYIEEAAAIT